MKHNYILGENMDAGATLEDGSSSRCNVKREKFAKKRKAQCEQMEKEEGRASFIRQHSHCLTTINMENIDNDEFQETLKPYRNLKDAENRKDGLFVLEGAECVRLLVGQAAFAEHAWKRCESQVSDGLFKGVRLKSIIVKPATFWDSPVKLIDDIRQCARDCCKMQRMTKDSHNLKLSEESMSSGNDSYENEDTLSLPYKVFVGKKDVLTSITGFSFDRGGLACAEIPTYVEKELWLQSFIEKTHDRKLKHSQSPLRILALDGICDTANMGSILRTSKAFDIDVVVLSKNCCDPFSRRSVRVSMGYACLIPIVRVNLFDFLKIDCRRFNIQKYAAVVDDESSFLQDVKAVSEDWCCVMGNEGTGISAEVIAECDKKIKINISKDVDSLSVGIATGILLNGLKEREGGGSKMVDMLAKIKSKVK